MRQLKITTSITSRSDKALDKYLQDISKEEMITADEETRLARLIYGGIGKTTSKRFVLAKPSLALALAKNDCGENAIKISS